MNVEKTIEFILQQQAKAEGEMAAIRKLLRTGMRILAKHDESIKEIKQVQKETQAELKKLAGEVKSVAGQVSTLASQVTSLSGEVISLATLQKQTQAELQAFIKSLRRGGNGHSRN